MNIQQLRYAAAVENAGSISKAAQTLFVSQPHLSKIIKELERELGLLLFTRSPDGVTSTPEGAAFLQRARRILEEMDALSDLYRESGEGENRFRLSTVRSSLVMDAFLKLCHRYEGEEALQFHLIETGGQQPIQDVYSQAAELGVVYIPWQERETTAERLEAKAMGYEPICGLKRQVILRSGHPLLKRGGPIVSRDLYPYGMVRYGDQPGFPSGQAEYLGVYGDMVDFEQIKRVIYVYDRASLHNLLCHTDCFTLGTRGADRQEETFGIVSVPLADRDPERQGAEMGVVYRKSRPLSPIGQTFLSILRETYRDDR